MTEALSGATAEALIDVSPTAIAITDAALRFLRHSVAWISELGLGERPVVGQTVAEVFPNMFHRIEAGLKAALAGETMRTEAVWVPLPDGRRACLRLEVAPWMRGDGSVGGLLMFVHDLTAANTALERSRRAERRLKVATEIAQVHVFEMDYASKTLTTDGAENSFFDHAITFEEMDADPFCGVHELDRERVMAEVMAAAQAGPLATHRSEYRVRRSDDQEIWASSSVEFETDSEGVLSNAIFALQNITDRKRAELALLVAKDEAEAANRAKSTFLATMSHEIRTPLNGVLGMAQAMAAEDLSPVQAERLAIIRDSGQTLLAILNDILDLSKIEAGKLALEATEFDLGRLLRGVEAAFVARADEKGLDFRLDLAPEAAGVYRGDPTRVKQVIYNLVSNAVKFTERGEVRVDVAKTDEGLVLKVRDTGPGLSPAALARLFQKFEQADASTTRRYGGSGLGLAISQELAGLMGGQVTVESREGDGATFTTVLALERIADPELAGAEAANETHPGELPSIRVLAAEDNPTNQKVIATLLQQVGIDPVIAANGAEAVASWEREPFDVILMDVQMPELDGVEATRRIRAAEAASGRPRTPILALSANAMSHQLEAYAAVGMDGFIAKPIEVARLFAAIEAALVEAPGANDDPRGLERRQAAG